MSFWDELLSFLFSWIILPWMPHLPPLTGLYSSDDDSKTLAKNSLKKETSFMTKLLYSHTFQKKLFLRFFDALIVLVFLFFNLTNLLHEDLSSILNAFLLFCLLFDTKLFLGKLFLLGIILRITCLCFLLFSTDYTWLYLLTYARIFVRTVYGCILDKRIISTILTAIFLIASLCFIIPLNYPAAFGFLFVAFQPKELFSKSLTKENSIKQQPKTEDQKAKEKVDCIWTIVITSCIIILLYIILNSIYSLDKWLFVCILLTIFGFLFTFIFLGLLTKFKFW